MKINLTNIAENYDEFIGIYDNVFPEGYCEHVIECFENLKKMSAGSDRTDETYRHLKDDYHVFFELHFKHHAKPDFLLKNDEGSEISISTNEIFFLGLQNCYNLYSKKYSVLKQNELVASHMKVQKTSKGQGYHVWHGEQSQQTAERVLVYSLYLNDLPPNSGGETEFLYQGKRYSPRKNRLIIWPAAYTHAHRGNPVLCDQDKYIVTGWFYFS